MKNLKHGNTVLFCYLYIDKFARDANGNVIVIDLNYDSQINESILKIWNKYKRLNGIELSKLTRILYSANQVTD